MAREGAGLLLTFVRTAPTTAGAGGDAQCWCPAHGGGLNPLVMAAPP